MSSTLHVTLLFPSMRPLVLGLIPCGNLVSGFVLTIFQLLVSNTGVPLFSLFIVYSCIQLFFITFNLSFQPFRPFTIADVPKRDENGYLIKNDEKIIVELPMEEKEIIKVQIEEEKKKDEPNPQVIQGNTEKSISGELNPEDLEMKEEEKTKKEERRLEKTPINQTLEDSNQQLEENNPPLENVNLQDSNVESKEIKPEEKKEEPKKPSVYQNFLTIEFWLITYFLCINSMIIAWYNGTLFTQFTLMGDTDHVLATAFSFTLLGVLIIFPIYGTITKMFGVPGALSLCVTFAILLLTTISIPYKPIQPIGFVLFLLCRPLQTSATLEFIHSCFGFGNIGRLFGVITCLLGFISFLQIPEKQFVSAIGNKYWVMNLILICFSITSYSIPLLIFIRDIYKGNGFVFFFKRVYVKKEEIKESQKG